MEAGAASAKRSSEANSNALTANVLKLKGRNINVAGNSLSTSTNTIKKCRQYRAA